jgi:hypothetical protein
MEVIFLIYSFYAIFVFFFSVRKSILQSVCLSVTWNQRLNLGEHFHFTSRYSLKETRLRDLSPPANYTDRATAACRRS